MKFVQKILPAIALLLCSNIFLFAQQAKLLKRSDIYIRGPFILADAKTQTYYMYSSSYGYKGMPGKKMGITVYKSKDLNNWEGPSAVFETGNGFWADTTAGCWAPEVHEYKGQYYLFATFSNSSVKLKNTLSGTPDDNLVRRGTVILKADSPSGPFQPVSKKSETPPQWMALDGTFFIENKKPYMVFCHEWVQAGDGTVEMVKLKNDLSALKSKPVTLFKATDAPWVAKINYLKGGYITDGPAFYRNKKNELIMLWSSLSKNGYAVGQAISSSGNLPGPWKQIDKPLFDGEGGHSSLFKTFDGRLVMSIHQPNKGDNILCHLFELREDNEGLLAIDKELPVQ